MAGYLVAHLDVTDPKTFERYRAAAPAVIARYGGRYLIRGGAAQAVEGDWTVPRLIVLEFPSTQRAREFYDSREYQDILPLRLSASKGTVAIVEGYAG
jgi:uncharacterized protein (DUF1330 family)